MCSGALNLIVPASAEGRTVTIYVTPPFRFCPEGKRSQFMPRGRFASAEGVGVWLADDGSGVASDRSGPNTCHHNFN